MKLISAIKINFLVCSRHGSTEFIPPYLSTPLKMTAGFTMTAMLCSLFLVFTSLSCAQHVRTGAEVLLEKHLQTLQNKKIGVVCNHTSLLPDGTHLVDALRHKGVNVTTLFAPEHGIRGGASAGEHVNDSIDPKTGLQIFSLYGKNRKPSSAMLNNVDVLVFDLQDVGARFYTYSSTMAYAMQSAAENGKKFIVLDRPNLINGIDIEGPVLDTALKSFVGMFPVPIRHGLTLGELAKMIIGERWMENLSNLDLTVIAMEGWKREMWYDETGLPWIPPSPNIKSLSTATVYPGTCLFEGSNVSEGRGTGHPFEYIGAPWINGDSLRFRLETLHLAGVRFSSIHFTPVTDSVTAIAPKYNGEKCGGVYVTVTDRKQFLPFKTALAVLSSILDLYPDSLKFKGTGFDRLAGSRNLRKSIENGQSLGGSSDEEKKLFDQYLKFRKNYILY